MPAKNLYSLTMNRLILWGDKRYRLILSVLSAFAAGQSRPG